MKKQSILSLVALVAILLLSSCNSNKYEAKTVTLKTQNDSLNYTLGLANGETMKNQLMQKDSSDKAIATFIQAIETAYKKNASKDEMYQLGLRIGEAFKQQKASGLYNDSTLAFNPELVKQGLINALRDYKEGMTPKQAQEYIEKTMTAIQAQKLGSQPQMPSPQQAPQQAPQPQAN